MKSRILGALLIFTVGCGASQINQARQGVVAGIHVFSTAAQALQAARGAEEQSLLKRVDDRSMTVDQAEVEYKAWMAKGQKAVDALETLWDSIKAGASVIAAVDAKLAGDLPGALANITEALAHVAAALADLGVKI